MKNGLLIWNVLLTILVGYLLFTQFGSKKGDTRPATKNNGTDSVAKDFRIAYFEMDSVEAHFGMVKDVKAELLKREDAITAELEGLTRNMQQKYNYYQNQAQSGTLTQAQSESASQELKALDDQLKSKKQSLDQQYSDYAMRRTKDIKTAIEKFVQEFNKDKYYSYIVAEEPGLFYFKDTLYNITPDVIKGLNGQYNPSAIKKD